MKVYSESFASVGDFLTHLDSIQAPAFDSKKAKGRSTFYELESWADTMVALRTGWQKGVDAVNSKSARIEAVLGASVMRDSYAPAVTGQFFDIGLVMSGEPECWLETAQEDTGSKVVTISINASISAACSRQTIIDRGAAVCALVKLLETQGKSCRVVYGMGFNTNYDQHGDAVRLEVLLKREGDPLDLDTLAFWLVCPDAFRRLCFRYIEGHALFPRVGSTYGFPDQKWNPDSDIKLPAILTSEDWSQAKTENWIKDIMKAQGIAFD